EADVERDDAPTFGASLFHQRHEVEQRAGEPVELGDDEQATGRSRLRDRRVEPRPPLAALAGGDVLGEAGELEPPAPARLLDRLTLRLQAEPGDALLVGRDAHVADRDERCFRLAYTASGHAAVRNRFE